MIRLEEVIAKARGGELLVADPWQGFCQYIECICEMQAQDEGFAHVSTMTFPVAAEFEAIRKRAYAGFVELVQRAKASGDLRAEFAAEDLPLLLMANAGVLAVTGKTAPKASRRLVSYLLQAFSARRAKVALSPPPTNREMFKAMLEVDPLRARRGR